MFCSPGWAPWPFLRFLLRLLGGTSIYALGLNAFDGSAREPWVRNGFQKAMLRAEGPAHYTPS